MPKTIEFKIMDRNGAWNTQRVRGQSGSSTMGALEAGRRLAEKLAQGKPFDIKLTPVDEITRVARCKVTMLDGTTPPSQIDGQGVPGQLDKAGGLS